MMQDTGYKSNQKSEARNPKQARMTEIKIIQTPSELSSSQQ